MAETYNPRLFIAGYTAPAVSIWHQTGWTGDTPTISRGNLGRWTQTAWPNDNSTTDTTAKAFEIVEDTWS